MARQWGYALIVVGVVWIAVALNMDTSASTGENLHLVESAGNVSVITWRQSQLYIGGLLTVTGVLLAILGKRSVAGAIERNDDTPDSNRSPDERDLGEQAFPTSSVALEHGSASELPKLEEAKCEAEMQQKHLEDLVRHICEGEKISAVRRTKRNGKHG